MNKIGLFLLFSFVSTAVFGNNADSTEENRAFWIGIKGGVHFQEIFWYQSVSGTFNSERKSQTQETSSVGVDAVYQLNKHFSLSPSLMLTSRYNSFSAYRINTVSAIQEFKYQIDHIFYSRYLELYILGRYQYHFNKFNVSLAVGPYLAPRLSSSVTYNRYYIERNHSSYGAHPSRIFDPSDVKGNTYLNANEVIRGFDMGISEQLRLGYDIDLGIIFIEGGFTQGLLNILSNSYIDDELKINYPNVNGNTGISEHKQKNSSVAISAGFVYKLF